MDAGSNARLACVSASGSASDSALAAARCSGVCERDTSISLTHGGGEPGGGAVISPGLDIKVDAGPGSSAAEIPLPELNGTSASEAACASRALEGEAEISL